MSPPQPFPLVRKIARRAAFVREHWKPRDYSRRRDHAAVRQHELFRKLGLVS